MRAVLDASVLIAAFLSGTGASRALVSHAQARFFQLVVSPALLDEVERNLRRLGVPERIARDYVHVTQRMAVIIRPAVIPRVVTEHPPDDVILACAAAGNADAIVTLDRKHLLPLRAHHGILILPPRDCLATLRSAGTSAAR